MIFVPFIWFFGLTLFLWKKQEGIDVSVFLAAEYALTSLCAIICVQNGWLEAGGILFTAKTMQLGIVPTMLYCGLHTMLILPFTRLSPHKGSAIIRIENERMFNYFAYFLMIVAFLNVYIVLDNVRGVLMGGDFLAARGETYAGNVSFGKKQNLSWILEKLYFFNATTVLALPCFFYSICFLQRSRVFNLMLFCSSLSMPLYAIAYADRTEFIFFFQVCCVVFLIFRPFLKEKQWRLLRKILIPLVGVMLIYLTAVTMARWEYKGDGGTQGGVLQYAGQGYLNFCYFYEYADESYVHTERVFPLINRFVNKRGYGDVLDQIIAEQGFFTAVFPSYLGVIMLDIGKIGMIIWSVCLLLLMLFTFPKHTDTLSFGQILWYFAVCIIPLFGIFYYRNYEYTRQLAFVMAGILSVLFHYKFLFRT